jgi:hypothetical protein
VVEFFTKTDGIQTKPAAACLTRDEAKAKSADDAARRDDSVKSALETTFGPTGFQ